MITRLTRKGSTVVRTADPWREKREQQAA